MVTLEKIDSALFPKLYQAFLNDDDPYSGEEQWRDVFDYRWEKPEGHCGYALLDGDELVGMLGMVFSRRQIDGQERAFCNLHTWWVREDHRGHSLALLRPILKLRDYTLTHFTPCDRVRAVCKRLGFEELSSQLTVLLPLGRRGHARKELLSGLSFDKEKMEDRLSEVDRRLLRDHWPYRCEHLMWEEGNEYCYLLYTHVIRHRLPYCHIHYFSNRELFARREADIRRLLLERHQAWFAAVDTRRVEGLSFRRSFRFWAPANGLFKSDSVRPDQIDNLYSDIVMLNLTALPDLSHEVSNRVRKLIGRPTRA